MNVRSVMGGVYAVLAVIMIVAYLAGGRPDMHVGQWQEKKPRADQTCVTVDLDNRKYRHILDHVWDATQKGQPVRLHIAREGAAENRRESLRGIPTRHGYDRDEYPPAMSREGGKGADVRYVRSAENRGAGEVMSKQLSGYENGQCFQFERRPR